MILSAFYANAVVNVSFLLEFKKSRFAIFFLVGGKPTRPLFLWKRSFSVYFVYGNTKILFSW